MDKINQILKVVSETMGVDQDKIRSKNKLADSRWAKAIFSKLAAAEGWDNTQISQYLNVTGESVQNYKNLHDELFITNRIYSEIVLKVMDRLYE